MLNEIKNLVTKLSIKKAGEERQTQKAILHCNSSSVKTKHLQTV